MTVKIARLQNGEDVIADIKEVRDSSESERPIAYSFTLPYMVMIQQSSEVLFEEYQEGPKKLNNLKLELYPWVPLSSGDSVFVSLHQITSIYEPHTSVLEKYNELIAEMKSDGKDSSIAE
jgi:hypothetical protein